MTSNNPKIIIAGAALVSATVFSIFISVSLYQKTKAGEDKFNKEKAALIKEGMDLQDRIDGLSKELKEKAASVAVIESEKKAAVDNMKTLETEVKKSAKMYQLKIDTLKKSNDMLNKQLERIKNIPLTEMLKDALENENNENIKKLIENTIAKIDMIRQGKVVNLEPIVVTNQAGAAAPAETAQETGPAGLAGKILSVDKKNNLIVISLGRSNNVKEGQRCLIYKGSNEAASAEIITTRYKISAAFVDDVKYGYTINDVKEGEKVSISEEALSGKE